MENSLKVICSNCVKSNRSIFEHDTVKIGEQEASVTIYLDITNAVKEAGQVEVVIDRPQGPAPFEVDILSIEVY